MPFESPRFAGDTTLEAILSDPDTGTLKLQPGSPPESVTRVQQALWELWWPFKIDQPVADHQQFVDGVYGPATTRTVLRYKQQYDIRFPPNDPNGTFDGFAGPRTLSMLDAHCVLFDAGRAAIQARAAMLQADGVAVTLTLRALPILGTNGIEWFADVGANTGCFFWRHGVGAFLLRAPVDTTYFQAFKGPTGPLGWPTSEEHDDEPGFTRVEFEHGALRHDLAHNVVTAVGSVPTPTINF